MLSGIGKQDEKNKIHLGHFFIAIDTEAFMGIDSFKKTTGDIMRESRATTKYTGAERIYTDDEKEYLIWQEPSRLCNGESHTRIMLDWAIKVGIAVNGTGRSEFLNQVNNVPAFPRVFKGAMGVRVSDINEGMKVATSNVIASLVAKDDLKTDYVIPVALDLRVCQVVL